MASEIKLNCEAALVTKIQKFCTHDGPGIRTTVFFKGCPLKCRWCHNPETQHGTWEFFFSPNLCIGCGACFSVCEAGCHHMWNNMHIVDRERCCKCGRCADVCPSGAIESCARFMAIDDIITQVKKDICFYGKKGGLTLSGGEPLAQPEATLAVLRAAHESGVHTVIETCGYFDESYISELAALTDLFLFDYKHTDAARHMEYTGVSQERILANLQRLNKLKARIRLRCIMVADVNMDECHIRGISAQYHALQNCEGVELLPYHTFGNSKASMLGRKQNDNSSWIPSEEKMLSVRRELRKNGVKVL